MTKEDSAGGAARRPNLEASERPSLKKKGHNVNNNNNVRKKSPPKIVMSEMKEPPSRGLNREKSFDEARTAVQSQIEKMFRRAVEEKNNHHHPQIGRRKGLLGGITTAGSDLVASPPPPPPPKPVGSNNKVPTSTMANKTVGLLVEVRVFNYIKGQLIYFCSSVCLYV